MDILAILKELKDDVDFESSKDFVEDGLLDSFDIVNLVGELEDNMDIEISGRDIVPENFVSVEAIENMLEKYR
ncbi:MAG: acyl carrier protein [Lachnospiraceae bacterium]|nr:acyl carrier protein [Lachnospiraceae bacterium]